MVKKLFFAALDEEIFLKGIDLLLKGTGSYKLPVFRKVLL